MTEIQKVDNTEREVSHKNLNQILVLKISNSEQYSLLQFCIMIFYCLALSKSYIEEILKITITLLSRDAFIIHVLGN